MGEANEGEPVGPGARKAVAKVLFGQILKLWLHTIALSAYTKLYVEEKMKYDIAILQMLRANQCPDGLCSTISSFLQFDVQDCRVFLFIPREKIPLSAKSFCLEGMQRYGEIYLLRSIFIDKFSLREWLSVEGSLEEYAISASTLQIDSRHDWIGQDQGF